MECRDVQENLNQYLESLAVAGDRVCQLEKWIQFGGEVPAGGETLQESGALYCAAIM